MNKKLICAILCMFTMFIFTACGDVENHNQETGQDGKETTTWNSGDSLITGETKQMTAPPAAWEVSEETKLKSEKIEYNPKTDGDWRTSELMYCEGEDGNIYQPIYRTQELLPFLACYDAKSHGFRIMCSRPECYHMDEDCDAYLAEQVFGMEYYNGKIYTVMIERDNSDYFEETEDEVTFSSVTYADLYAIDPGKNSREKVQSLKIIERKNAHNNISGFRFSFTIHRGYVYYEHSMGEEPEREDYYRNGKNCIFRVPLGGTEADAECIYVLPKNQSSEGSVYDQDIVMKPYGSYVYFIEYLRNPDGVRSTALRRIDTVNKRVERIPLAESPDYFYYAAEEGIYYSHITEDGSLDGKLRLHRLEDGTEEIVMDYGALAESEALGCYFDGTCWYAQFNKGQDEFVTDFIVLDSNFKKIGELDFGAHLLMPISAKHQMVLFTEDDKLYGWLNKADIAKGDLTVHRAEMKV